ncbi:heat shock protein HSP98 [Saitoella complicata NRRL Y-17804]|uniref:Clp R domain-containing protein n=1 Tax=Saitoella complicata (strain BCRC 22490 / CBS 7301 / JCM 7358 / NBRC 10748 / NRRL Y-17804) TaxID=698492 RepID=A0A0E9NS10_SAICN|nr:heat shock protein HSP98 [Saitoella complicata NRRL Y-17804]ODQ50581.1 heat shock protein HSP98 [Saitoella complicata NRRL Y-17804]GAO52543.1 hypothetical protein G7K_6617-t1 [Saitoella complicata NRRL Y-17804]
MSLEFTEKATQVLSLAQDLVRNYKHVHLEPVHIADALLSEDSPNPLLATIIDKAGGDVQAFSRYIKRQLVRRPSQDPPPETPSLSPGAAKVIRSAQDLAKKQKDSFVAIDHMISALSEDASMKTAFSECGISATAMEQALLQARGNKRVESKSFEEGFEALSKYTADLTEQARDGSIDPVIGREDEIRRVIRILSRRTKNNPVLIGEPGVGKTSIAEGLAQRIVNADVPANLASCRLLSLDVGSLVAGTKYRGEFEERMKSVLNEIEGASEQIILFVDEMHLLMGAGGSGEGGMDAANLLKPMLARGKLHCIGATTLAEYRKYIEKDAAFERRFQQVLVKEPSVPDTLSILRGLKEKYEVHHGVTIADAALVAAATLASRYLTSRKLPDSAIDLVDEAAASVRVERESQPEVIDNLERRLRRLQVEIHALERESDAASKERLNVAKQEAANVEEELRPLREKYELERKRGDELQEARKKLDQLKAKADDAERRRDLQTAADLRYYGIPDLQRHIENLEAKKAEMEAQAKPVPGSEPLLTDVVGPDQINEIVARWTGIPVTRLKSTEKDKLLNMERLLAKQVVGQREAITAVSNAIRLSRSGLSNPNQPIASFLFCGPSGTGKTLLTKSLAEFLFDDEKSMIRIDCTEYMEKHSVSKLIGSPPGYIGHDEGGQLTEQLRRKPYSVILFDEVEKADPSLLTVLLQLLDDGRITDSKGTVVDARNALVILTSNLGAEFLTDAHATPDGKVDAPTREAVMGAVRRFFRPEFINRLSAIVMFNRLAKREIRKIVDIRLQDVQKRLESNNKNVRIEVDDKAKAFLGEAGYSPAYGARPLNRVIQNEVLNKLAVMLLRGQIQDGEVANVTCPDGHHIEILPNHQVGEEGVTGDEDDEMDYSDEDEMEMEPMD